MMKKEGNIFLLGSIYTPVFLTAEIFKAKADVVSVVKYATE